MGKVLKMCGLYLLVQVVVTVGVIFLLPMPANAADNDDDWQDEWQEPAPAADNHLLDIVGNLMQLTDFNLDANLTITTDGQVIGLQANVDAQVADNFATVAATGRVAVELPNWAAALQLTYLDNHLYADFNNLHLSASVPALVDGLPTILGWCGVDFTWPDLGNLDVSALLAQLQDYTETPTTTGYAVVLTVAGCAVELTCDADFHLQHAVIPALTLGKTTLAGEVTLTTYPTPLTIAVPAYDYVDVPQLVQFFTNLVPTFQQPFAISGQATLSATVDGVPQADNYLTADLGRLAVATKNGLLDQLAIELAVSGAGEFVTTNLQGHEKLSLGAYFNGDNTDGGVYINFDGLKLHCAKANLADTYAALQNLLTLFLNDDIMQYTNLFYFNDNNDMVFNTALLGQLLGDFNAADIITRLDTYLPYLQSLTLTADNVLTLTLVDHLLTLQLYPTADGAYHLRVESVLAEQNRAITATLTLQALDAFTGTPDDAETYLNVSEISTLLNAVNHTVRHQEFRLTGTVHISVASLLNVNVPVEIFINHTDPARGLVIAAHFALPYEGLQKMVLDSAPTAAGTTQDGTRNVYLYYQQGYIYLYRTEQVQHKEQVGTKLGFIPVYEYHNFSYQKAVKLTMQQFTDDALNWLLKWGFGFSENIMKQITDAITNNTNANDPLDYGDLVHGFTVTDGRYDIVLNLGEIAHNPDLKDFTIKIATAPDENGDTQVAAVGLEMKINVGISIVLETTGDGLTLTTGAGVADVTTALNWIDNYQWADGVTWHTIYQASSKQAEWVEDSAA